MLLFEKWILKSIKLFVGITILKRVRATEQTLSHHIMTVGYIVASVAVYAVLE